MNASRCALEAVGVSFSHQAAWRRKGGGQTYSGAYVSHFLSTAGQSATEFEASLHRHRGISTAREGCRQTVAVRTRHRRRLETSPTAPSKCPLSTGPWDIFGKSRLAWGSATDSTRMTSQRDLLVVSCHDPIPRLPSFTPVNTPKEQESWRNPPRQY